MTICTPDPSLNTKPTHFVRNSTLKNTVLKISQTTNATFLRLASLSAILIFPLTVIRPSFAADDDYLRSLNDESNGLSNTTTTSGKSNNYLDALSEEAESSSKVSTSQHDDDYYKALKKMEEFLKTKKPSTYKFYKKLTPKKQTRVFEHYSADKSDPDARLTHLKKQVMDAYFKK